MLDCAVDALLGCAVERRSSLVEEEYVGLFVERTSYAYALAQQKNADAERALALMNDIPAENNTIIRQWRALGQRVRSAADSQALLHLFQHYCQHERCIHCEVGSLVFLDRVAEEFR